MEQHWTRSPAGFAAAVAAGGLAGAGARLVKHLLEQRRTAAVPRVHETPIVPVEVTPEEALELERQGTDVQLKTAEGSSSALGGVIRGAVGTGAALGTYKLVDSWLEARRRRELQGDIQQIRNRIQQVLTDQPSPEDIPLHASMKAAEDHYMKTAGIGGMVANGVDSAIPTWMSVPAGAAALIAALTSFRQVRENNRYGQRISDLRRAVKNEQLSGQGAPRLQLAPVVDPAKLKALLSSQAAPAVVAEVASKPKKHRQEPEDAPVPAGSPSSQAPVQQAF